MSDASEKPFDPTPQRLERAKREGNVARAGELAANLSFACAAATLAGLLPPMYAVAREALDRAARGSVPAAACAALLACALVPVAAGCAACVAAGALQNGGLRLAAVTFKPERMDPAEGLKRLLSRDSASHAFRALLAFVVAAGAMLPALAHAALLAAASLDARATAGVAWQACGRVAGAALAAGSLFAVAEFAGARKAWLKKLRMSFEERKREAKEQDGDPHARGRRRSLHRALLRGAIARVREAAFVIANPTHVAIALDYRPPDVPVPRVLVRASGDAALRVRELAAQHGVPVVENVPLARALFRDVRAGECIPQAQYVAVAEVVAALMRAGVLRR